MNREHGTLAEALHELKDRALSSVEFVQDYVQLRFDGPCLTAYNLPAITLQESTVSWGEPRYRDLLCQQIGRRVQAAEVIDGEHVSLKFEEDAVLKISLRTQDYRGPEALQFISNPNCIWVA
jgi:hypothetical protein